MSLNFDDIVKSKTLGTVTRNVDGLGEVEIHLFPASLSKKMSADESDNMEFYVVKALKGADHEPTDAEIEQIANATSTGQQIEIIGHVHGIKGLDEAGKL